MIKAVKDKTVILGFSDLNIHKLDWRNKDAAPIVVKLNDLGFKNDIEIIIFRGKDEETMYMNMLDKIGPDTKML